MQVQVEDGNTRGPVCRDPGAASTQGGGGCPSPFHVFPGGQVCHPRAAGAAALRGPSVPEGSFPAVGWPQRGDLAPGSAGLAPGHQVPLNWRGPLFFLVVKKAI